MTFSEFKQRVGEFKAYVILALVLVVVGYLGFKLGFVLTQAEQDKIKVQAQSINNLKQENHQLVKQLNILGVELEVAKLAQQKSFDELAKAIDQERALKKQIGFYQQVMAPELNQEGFLIEGFNVEPSLSDNSYRFELILMQQEKIKQPLKGNLTIKLVGSEHGQAKQYGLAELLVGSESSSLNFGFKYFQVIDGEMTLPEGFVPELVSVHAQIYQNRKWKGELTSEFDWLISQD